LIPDADFGYVLHPVDLGINKLMAAASGREPRDAVDLLTIDRNVLPIGALAWAAVEAAPGFTPAGLIGEVRRNARFNPPEWAAAGLPPSLDPGRTLSELRAAPTSGEAFVASIPCATVGRLFLDQGRPVAPDPTRLADYILHAPTRHGHWPTSPAIETAMLERLQTMVV
jgi:hypothetical protein